MFRYEKEMIPILRDNLSQIFNTNYFLEEFSSGLGIADLVFTTNITKRHITLEDYESMYYLTEYFNKHKIKIEFDKVVKRDSLNKVKADMTINYLRELNLINEYEEGKYFVHEKYIPSTNELYSVEAKLSDWKKGFYQALKNKVFSHKSFLAISEEFIHRVDIELFKNQNVGLISVNKNEIKIVLSPKNIIPSNKTAFYFLSENFASQFAL